jgi:hypothetical protein
MRDDGPRRCLDLLRGVCAADPDERRTWAGATGRCSARGELDAHEELTLGWALAWAAAVETHCHDVRAGLMGSLGVLAGAGRVPAAALDLVIAAIDPTDLHVVETAPYAGLVAARARPPRVVRPSDPPNLPGAVAGEPIGPAQCLHLIRRIASGSATERRAGAAVTARRAGAGELDDDEARTVAAVLAWAVEEGRSPARPALLAALHTLADRDRAPAWALDRMLARLADAGLDAVEEDFRVDLATALAAHRRRISAGA